MAILQHGKILILKVNAKWLIRSRR